MAHPDDDLPEADLVDLLGADFDPALLERLAITPAVEPAPLPAPADDRTAA